MRIRAVAHTDVGRVREENEDAYLLSESGNLFAVADGMGGHAGGQVAARLALEAVAIAIDARLADLDLSGGPLPVSESPLSELVGNAIRDACTVVFDRAATEPELLGMGTTLTLMLVAGAQAFVAHVGDSRCYLMRGDRFIQVTDDHSLVQEQYRAGLLTAEEARTSPYRNVLTRSVGVDRDVSVDVFALDLECGDRFLLCSDGLVNRVDDAEIGRQLRDLPVDDVPKSLVDLANMCGGEDNITVLCLLVEADGEPQPPTNPAPSRGDA